MHSLTPQQEVTRPKARFKPTSPEKSWVDEGANQVVSCFTCTPHDDQEIYKVFDHLRKKATVINTYILHTHKAGIVVYFTTKLHTETK